MSDAKEGRTAIGASAWALMSHLGLQGLRVVGNLLLTRMLFPEIFGIMAVMQAIQVGLEMFSDIGLGPAVIRSKRYNSPHFNNAVWTLSVLRGIILWLAASLMAWPLAQFLDEPSLFYMLPVASFAVALAGAKSTWEFVMERELIWKPRVLILVGSSVLGLVVMLLLALWWKSPWSLISGILVTSSVQTVLSHLVCARERQRLVWDREINHEVLHFGKWIFLSTLLTFLAYQVDQIFMAKIFSLHFLGVFGIARGAMYVLQAPIQRLQQSVLFPLLTEHRDELSAMKGVIHKYQILVLAPMLLALGMIAGHSESIVSFFYDNRYHEAGWMLEFLLLMVAVELPFSSGQQLSFAYGRPYYSTLFMGVNALVTLVALGAAAYTGSPLVMLAVMLAGRLAGSLYLGRICYVFGLHTPRLASMLFALLLIVWGSVKFVHVALLAPSLGLALPLALWTLIFFSLCSSYSIDIWRYLPQRLAARFVR